MKMLLTIIFVSATLSNSISAQGLKSETDLQNLFENVVKSITQEKFQSVADAIKPYYPSSAYAMDNFSLQLANKWVQYKNVFGALIDTENLPPVRLGKSFIKYRCLLRFAFFAVRLEVTTYLGYNGYFINSINIYDSVDDTFK